jgi:hypothetical protein
MSRGAYTPAVQRARPIKRKGPRRRKAAAVQRIGETKRRARSRVPPAAPK